ncbi:MAG: hypothetical protein HZA92_04550 [Verrucomicrobia bacterium]|nr:hypothetical protein [Verrucomicrobiota bacterium]
MKNEFATMMVLCASLSITALGCRKKSATGPANAELEKAANALASTEATSTSPPSEGLPPLPAPGQQLKQAVEAYKSGKFEDAVVRLQQLRATQSVSAQQRMVLNDAMAAVMTDIYALAAKGDSRAVQAVKQYELMQSQRR